MKRVARPGRAVSGRIAFVLAAISAAGCGSAGTLGPQQDLSPTGVTRSYTLTATYGDYALLMDGGMQMGAVSGYLLDGQFIGPTLIAEGGDTIQVTLVNETAEPMGLHPHGVRYDMDNDGVARVADPGEEVTYTWEATLGYGTFLYHSHELDGDLVEYQGMAGVLGVLVVRDPSEVAAYEPDYMLNYVLMDTYEPWTVIDESMMGGGSEGEQEEDDHPHNHTMVLQAVSGTDETTDTLESLTAFARLGDTIRVNVIGFGETFHTFHTHGLTWNDPYTGQLLDSLLVGPGTYYHFYLHDLDNPGLWMVHCHVDSHVHMMTTYLYVE